METTGGREGGDRPKHPTPHYFGGRRMGGQLDYRRPAFLLSVLLWAIQDVRPETRLGVLSLPGQSGLSTGFLVGWEGNKEDNREF